MADSKRVRHGEAVPLRRDEMLQAAIQQQGEVNGEVVFEFGSCTPVENRRGCRMEEYVEHSRTDRKLGF